MFNIPDFSKYGYQIIKRLGQDTESSNITWQGKIINNNTLVIIKQFCFATKDSSWTGYQAYQKEIELLKKLNYLGIPKYIASFETDNSFCFVREYIEGKSLAKQTNITEKELKSITVKVLNILIYLQQQQPPLFHLNLTPNNILIDPNFNIYLINLYLTQTANSEVNYSLIKTSNAEFIAPEQLKLPCSASDNYGLGSTVNRVINNRQSLALVATNNHDDYRSQLELDSGFQEWLNIMTEEEANQRYPDAETALQALQNSSWDDLETVANSSDNIALSARNFAIGIATMSVLGFAIAAGFHVTQRVTEKSVTNIAIALMGMAIIYLAQSAAATLITNDRAEKKQGIALAVTTPIVLAIVTGVIFGRGEAVAMSLAAIIAQTATLAYVLLQKLPLSQSNNTIKVVGLGIAIALGAICGAIIH